MFASLHDIAIKIPMLYFLGVCLLATFAFFFHLRAGSSFSVIGKIYAIMIGRSEFHNKDIDGFWKERQDVERFNALFNVGAKSVDEVVGFKDWVKKYNLDVRAFTNLKGRINFERMCVRRTECWAVAALLALASAFLTVALLLFTIALSNSALLKFHSEEQWIWLSYEEAYNNKIGSLLFGRNEWLITASECEEDAESVREKMISSGLRRETVDILCASFVNEEDAVKLEEIIKSQRFLLIPAIGALLVMLLPYFELLRMMKATNARRHIYRKYLSYRSK